MNTSNRNLCILLIVVTSLLGACSKVQQPELKNKCAEPRPGICTQIYNPVCALSDNGFKTYPSDCSACSNKTVSGYNPGSCEEQH